MSRVRFVEAGTTYILTRRCTQRQFLLRPSDQVNQAFSYLLGVGAERFNVDLHALCAMSNHHHAILTDVDGRIPEFCEFLHGESSSCLNRLLGRRENFWDNRPYNAVRLIGSETVLEKCAYVLANPVRAGLVRRAYLWPGVWTPPHQIGKPGIIIPRPGFYFRENGTFPDSTRLRLVRPPQCADWTDEEVERYLAERLAAIEEETAEERAREGKRFFMGVSAVLAQSPESRPTSPRPETEIVPEVACSDPELREAEIEKLRVFRAEYRAAYRRFREGERDVVFPAGTYWMRVHLNVHVACRDPPEAS